MSFGELAERLAEGRALSAFDEEAVATVAGLLRRVRDARARVDAEGTIIDDGKGFPVEHPALVVEKRASAEIRGWVKDRPDLFGERRQSGPRREKFSGFKAV